MRSNILLLPLCAGMCSCLHTLGLDAITCMRSRLGLSLCKHAACVPCDYALTGKTCCIVTVCILGWKCYLVEMGMQADTSTVGSGRQVAVIL